MTQRIRQLIHIAKQRLRIPGPLLIGNMVTRRALLLSNPVKRNRINNETLIMAEDIPYIIG